MINEVVGGLYDAKSRRLVVTKIIVSPTTYDLLIEQVINSQVYTSLITELRILGVPVIVDSGVDDYKVKFEFKTELEVYNDEWRRGKVIKIAKCSFYGKFLSILDKAKLC